MSESKIRQACGDTAPRRVRDLPTFDDVIYILASRNRYAARFRQAWILHWGSPEVRS